MPSDPDAPASGADRERHAEILRHAYAKSRFGPDELDTRLAGVGAARTVADLEALTADLPERDTLRDGWIAWGAVTVIVGLMWLITRATGGPSFPWFLVISAPWAAVLLTLTLRKRSSAQG
ncbi:uncharacterized protein DUF1707 [Actinocorallia herbida]|uniref:Uncharacterized protein DUF1707 n=1 Tax=Actinocorallia herbida TaxID=58109 RepID=A0A3N1CZS9_9ACTN|nr:DUF1707 domain-containing protein [Actinocorallia herbida]ROO86288.1 uncharacterized protein DUF1707 [Actinocorallia herbida]